MFRVLPNNQFEEITEAKLAQLSANEEVVVIAADWDGCFDVLFDELLRARPHLKSLLLQFREKFYYFLEQITQNKIVILVPATNRQSHPVDSIGDKGGYFSNQHYHGNNNGLCLEKLPELCEQKQWLYCSYLLADTEHEVPAGTAYRDKTLNYSIATQDKLVIALNHLCYFEQQCPQAKKIDYYFFDDLFDEVLSKLAKHFTKSFLKFNKLDPDILPQLQKRFQNGTIMRDKKIPENMHIHLVMSGWANEIFGKNMQSIPSQVLAHIHKGQNLLKQPMLLDSPPVKPLQVTPAPLQVAVAPAPLQVAVAPAPLQVAVAPAPLQVAVAPAPLQVVSVPPPASHYISFGDIYTSLLKCSCCLWKSGKKTKASSNNTPLNLNQNHRVTP